jgi:hypothetical protein
MARIGRRAVFANLMRRVVVSDGRWRDATGLQAEPTQRLDHELMRSAISQRSYNFAAATERQ